MKFLYATTALFVLTSYANEVLAQSSACDKLVVPTKFDTQLNHEEELTLATLVESKEEYERVIAACARGSYGLFDAGGNYSDYTNNKTEKLEQYNFHLDKAQAQRLSYSYLPPTWLRILPIAS